jgi:hypothetical protein
MNRLLGKALTAMTGGVLLVSLGIVAASEAQGAGVAAALQEDDDVADQGGVVCDTEPGGEVFYPGKSASATYNEKFAQVGEDPLPYLRDIDLGNDYWIPQGLGYWANWDGQGNDLLLVAAYQEHADSIIYGIDPATGEHRGSVEVSEGHVGGVVVLGDWAYVPGSAGGSRTIRRYDLDELREKLGEGGLPWLDSDEDPAAEASWLGTDGSIIYAGGYQRGDEFGPPLITRYAPGEDGSLKELDTQYVGPLGTQGMTVVDGDLYFSVSPDHTAEGGLRSYLYRVSEEDMADNVFQGGSLQPFETASECYSAPSMSEGLATHGEKTYLAFESGSQKFDDLDADNHIEHLHVGRLGSDDDDDDGGGGDPDKARTTTTYTGPVEADFHDAFSASARLSGDAGPVSGATVEFVLGAGGGSQTCAATTDRAGVASCSLTPTQTPGTTTMTARFAGSPELRSSTDTVPFTITRQETALRYTGPERVANGTPTELSGVLTEESTSGPPVGGRSVTLALGTGETRQACTATTNADGAAACAIDSVNQPLNADATVPVTVTFDGDASYEPSTAQDTVLLEYYTGRSYGMAADVGLLGIGVGVAPVPDTGPVRTAQATETAPDCLADKSIIVLSVRTLCPRVVTSLAPGTSRSTTTVQDVTIGLPGLPVIEADGVTAHSTSTCGSGGSAAGTVDLTLRVGGETVEVSGEPNAVVDLPGLAKLVVNEQVPVPGADHGLTVNAVHLVTADGAVDVVIASATSDVHNCVS